jgi:CheY-like chemotaxis protein
MINELTRANTPSPRVLVIDDCLDSVRLMSHVFDHYQCDMTMAFDGQDAISLLKERSYDLLVLDWNMPKLGGRETLLTIDRLIREKMAKKSLRPLPVVIYSSDEDVESKLPTVGNFDYRGVFSKRHSFKAILRSFSYILSSI